MSGVLNTTQNLPANPYQALWYQVRNLRIYDKFKKDIWCSWYPAELRFLTRIIPRVFDFHHRFLQSLIMAPRTIIHLESTRCFRQSISCDSYRKVTFKSSQGDIPYSKDLFSHSLLVHHYSAVTISAQTSTSYRYISRKTLSIQKCIIISMSYWSAVIGNIINLET